MWTGYNRDLLIVAIILCLFVLLDRLIGQRHCDFFCRVLFTHNLSGWSPVPNCIVRFSLLQTLELYSSFTYWVIQGHGCRTSKVPDRPSRSAY